MQADMQNLHKVLQIRLTQYQHQIGKPMSTPAIAQLLSNLLYYKRFFPYYTFNVLGGLDDDGKHFTSYIYIYTLYSFIHKYTNICSSSRILLVILSYILFVLIDQQ